MRTLKRFAALSLCVLLCFSMCGVTAFAEEPDAPDLTGGVVTGLPANFIWLAGFYADEGVTLTEGGSFDKLDAVVFDFDDNIEYFAWTITVSLDGESYELPIEIDWNYSEIDIDTTGNYTFIGRVKVPEGVTFADGVLPEIRIPVTVVSPAPPDERVEITVLYNVGLFNRPVILVCGDEEQWECEQNRFDTAFQWMCGTTWLYDCETGLYAESIDVGGVDIFTPGTYTVTIMMALEDKYTDSYYITDEARTVNISVIVLPAEDALSLVYIERKPEYIKFKYKNNISLGVSLWYQCVEPGEDPDEELFEPFPHSAFYDKVDGFDIPSNALREGVNYYLQLRAGDNAISNIVRINLSELDINDDGYVGDRDGGDGGGNPPSNGGNNGNGTPNGGNGNGSGNGGTQTPADPPKADDSEQPGNSEPQTPNPDAETTLPGDDSPQPEVPDDKTEPPVVNTDPPAVIPSGNPGGEPNQNTVPVTTQPKPTEPPQSTTAPAEPFREFFGKNEDIISGTRLLMMLSAAGEAQFSKQGVTVTLLKNSLSGLNITDSDRFAVTIALENEHTFSFAVSLNDTPITALAGTRVSVPYHAAADSSLSLTDEQGRQLSGGSYNSDLAVASFVVDSTGRYIIAEEPVPLGDVPTLAPAEISSENKPPILPIALASAAVLGTGGVFLLRRWRLPR